MGLTKDEKTWFTNQMTAQNDQLEKKIALRFDESIEGMKQTIADLQAENQQLRARMIDFDIKCDDIEQYSRRMAIRVEGIPWKEGETNEELEKTSLAEFKKSGVVVQSSDIVRLHRSSGPKEKDGVTSKQAIIKFASWKAREKFAGFNKKARATDKRTKKFSVRVNNDLTKRRLVLLTDARNQIKAKLSRAYSEEQMKELPDHENVFAYANINSELRMRVRGKVLKFNTIPELQACMVEAFPHVANVA